MKLKTLLKLIYITIISVILKFVLEKIEQTVNKNVELLEDDILEGFFGVKDKHRK